MAASCVAITQCLSKQACRHTLEDIDSQKVEYIQLDLMDKPAVQKKLRRQHVNDVTYVFHLAFHGELPGPACKLTMLCCHVTSICGLTAHWRGHNVVLANIPNKLTAGDTTNITNGTYIMMCNLVEGLEANRNPLRHVYFPQGQSIPSAGRCRDEALTNSAHNMRM